MNEEYRIEQGICLSFPPSIKNSPQCLSELGCDKKGNFDGGSQKCSAYLDPRAQTKYIEAKVK